MKASLRDEEHTTNKLIHTLENLNFASPFRDWDDGDYSIQQFRKRASAVRKEMIWTQLINFIALLLMMVPLWYTGTQTSTSLTNPLSSFSLSDRSSSHLSRETSG